MKSYSVSLEKNGTVSMDFHLRKEVRCILPYWALAFGTMMGVGMLPSHMGWLIRLVVPPTFAVLTMMVGAASFGSEFQHRTMPTLLLQPLERAVLWRSKMIVLGMALLSLVVAVGLVPPNFYPEPDYPFAFVGIAFDIFGMAPWLTLFAGDGLIGAGLTFAIAGSSEIILQALFDRYSDYFHVGFFVCVLLGVIGLYYGRKAFMQWEFSPRWRPRFAWLDSGFVGPFFTTAQADRKVAAPLAIRHAIGRRRKQTAFGVLVRKELRLHSVSIFFVLLFCLGFALIVPLVHFLPDREFMLKHSVQVYCAMFPVITGAISVAGERQLGLLEWHLSLPVSVVRQFLVKMSVCISLALGAGFVLPWALLRLRGPLPEWFPASLFFLLALIGGTIGVCSSSFQPGTLRAAMTGLAGLWPVVVGGLSLHSVFIERGIYMAFDSGPSIVCNRFTLWGVMAVALAVLFRLAFGGYRNSTTLSRLWAFSIVVIVMGLFLAAGILAMWPETVKTGDIVDRCAGTWVS